MVTIETVVWFVLELFFLFRVRLRRFIYIYM